MKQTATKREDEKQLVRYMIQYYCRKHDEFDDQECQELIDYAWMRIDRCPFMETKTFCSACKVHCYQAEKRQKIREVMRYSGPRMLWHHPWMALKHLYIEHKEKRL